MHRPLCPAGKVQFCSLSSSFLTFWCAVLVVSEEAIPSDSGPMLGFFLVCVNLVAVGLTAWCICTDTVPMLWQKTCKLVNDVYLGTSVVKEVVRGSRRENLAESSEPGARGAECVSHESASSPGPDSRADSGADSGADPAMGVQMRTLHIGDSEAAGTREKEKEEIAVKSTRTVIFADDTDDAFAIGISDSSKATIPGSSTTHVKTTSAFV